MNLRFENDSDFQLFKNTLRERLESHNIRHIKMDGRKPASVMMLFMNREHQPYVLLTKRSQKVSTHKGHIAFPGGKCDASDASEKETAFREAFEETGISPDCIDYLGRFDDYITKMTGFHVSTFVGAIEYPAKYVLSRNEVDEIIEAPLRLFMDKKNARIEMEESGGVLSPVYHYPFEGNDIWGMTAKILTEFSDKIILGNKTQ